MRRSHAQKALLLLLGAALIAPAGTIAASAPARRQADVPPEVVGAVLESPGVVVRAEGQVKVERVGVGARLRSTYPGLPQALLRVTVRGAFPPRAQRYVVRAGGRVVGYGVPSANGRALRVVTRDEAVLTRRVTARYEGRRPGPQAAAQLPGTTTLETIPNPGARGPLRVSLSTYHFGDRVFQPSEIGTKVELTGVVYYPTDLSGGPYPLVVFMHGNHSTCYRGSRAGFRWPCRKGWQPIPNYAGYGYIARRLASHGFVVVSISANGVNVHGNRVDDTGMRQRGELLDKHLDLWKEWSTAGGDPFGTTFVGGIDMTRIGTMGHSRGGEGVAWHKIVDEKRPDPYGIDAVLALAPVDFTRVKVNNAAFSVVLPYCDGDVSDLQGMHMYDDSRYAVPGDPTPKHTVTAFKANHNFFNTVWSPGHGFPGAFDDGRWSQCTGPRLTQRQQRRVGRAYVAGFFRRYLAADADFDPMWIGTGAPASIAPAQTLVSYLAPDTPETRRDLVRFTASSNLAIGEGGTAVSPTNLGLYGWCANTWETPCVPGDLAWRDIHLSSLSEGLFGWSNRSGALRLELSEGADVSGFDALQFRAVTNPGYEANLGIAYQDLTVVLVDDAGNRARVVASEVGNEALAFPLTRGRRWFTGHIIRNQVRFPLAGFEGVDLGDLKAVVIRFNRTRRGVLNLSDVAFSSPPG